MYSEEIYIYIYIYIHMVSLVMQRQMTHEIRWHACDVGRGARLFHDMLRRDVTRNSMTGMV